MTISNRVVFDSIPFNSQSEAVEYATREGRLTGQRFSVKRVRSSWTLIPKVVKV